MKTQRKHRLIEMEWPNFGTCNRPQMPSFEEYSSRIEITRTRMEKEGLTHMVVYSDREHFANLAWLTGFDPRFEEALLILGPENNPLILVGNECESRLNISPLFTGGLLRKERYQPFSLPDMPRDESRMLKDIFRGEGIGEGASVGCAGWKYMTEKEQPGASHALFMPAFIVDILRDLSGKSGVVDATAIFMNADNGLRTFASPSEIAYFEFTNILASEGMKNMLFHLEDGIIDYDLAKFMLFNGEPLGSHISLKSGGNRNIGLTGPMGHAIRRGDPMSSNICYWGSNCSRAGWVASSPEDIPAEARDYVDNFAGPYFEAMSEWFSMLRIGTTGGKITSMMNQRLPLDKYQVFFNPGHLIHFDEWLASPFFTGSEIGIHSGMVIQSDVIPRSSAYFSTRVEDGLVIADQILREALRAEFPGCYDRCMKRRDFMINRLGIDLPVEVLPLSNMAGIVPPFFLHPNTVIAMEN